MDVKNKILDASEIRAELARRKISKRQLSEDTGINYHYLVEIVNGYYPAFAMRERITQYLFPEGRQKQGTGNREQGTGAAAGAAENNGSREPF